MKATILVTGGVGFIGSHLCEALLSQGHTIVCVDEFNDYYDPAIKEQNAQILQQNKNFKLFRNDIRDVAALKNIFGQHKIDSVIHLAARAGVRPSIVNPMLYAEVNITGTLNLLEVCRQFGVNHFVFGSSSSVYGENSRVPFHEDDPLVHPISPYAVSKIGAEQYCRVYHDLFGINIAILRFFTVYGPRGRPDMAVYKFTKAIAAGKEIEMYGDGTMKRDYTYVADIVSGVVNAWEKKCAFEIFNLGNSNPVELHYLIQLIEQAVGKKAMIKRLPSQQGDVTITYADISKAKKLLGWQPKVRIEEGIKRFVEWYTKQHQMI